MLINNEQSLSGIWIKMSDVQEHYPAVQRLVNFKLFKGHFYNYSLKRLIVRLKANWKTAYNIRTHKN